MRFCRLKYFSCTALCWSNLCSFHLYFYSLQWAWLRLATCMPMSLTRATTGVFGLSHHCRSMCVLPQAIIKECTRETACSGGHTGAEVPPRAAGRIWGVQAGQRRYGSVAMGQTQLILSSLWERQTSFFPLHIIKFDITYVGMYHLNCIYALWWVGGR